MRRKGMLFAAVLTIGMGMSVPAWAGETTPSDESLDSLLSSLFDDDGVIENLLGDDGVVSKLMSDEETRESIAGLFEEDGPLAGVLPEDLDVGSMLESIGTELGDANSKLRQGIDGLVDMATEEDGSIDWDQIGGSVEQLIGIFADGDMDVALDGQPDEAELDAVFEEIMRPYKLADEAMFAYIGERNADVMDPGDVQIFSKKTGYISDIEQDEVKVLADFSQTNFAVEGDQMNMVSAASDTMLLTLAKDAQGNFEVIGEERAEDGEGYAASVEAMCDELGIPIDDFYSGTMLGAFNDAEALADYLTEHPEIATAEYQGEQLSAQELKTLADQYIDGLLGMAFADEEEAVTEAVSEE